MRHPHEQQPTYQERHEVAAKFQRRMGGDAGREPIEQLQTNHGGQTEWDRPERADRGGPVGVDKANALGPAARQQQRAVKTG